MESMPRLFLAAIVLMPLHIIEQLLFGIDELYELQGQVSTVVNWSSDPDRAVVVLVGLVVTVVLFFCYAFMVGGIPRLIATCFFGIEFMVESHHLVKTVVRGVYFPGAVTAMAIVALGAIILSRDWRSRSHALSTELMASRIQHTSL